jgi:tetratricopeptide (TPR) repeat protein/transcriptional regulator with XRE-family HTH domain
MPGARRELEGDEGVVFGSRLSACRRSAGLTQQELADRSALSVRAISNLELGRTRSPHPGTVRRLADALGLHGDVRAGFLAAAGRRLGGGAAGADHTPTAVVPRLLPAATTAFTGRQAEVAVLADLALDAAAGLRAGVVTISAINGMAGIGKTALAVHSAHQMAGHFPDGQIFIDLHGYTSDLEPMTAAEALDWLLRCLGTPAQLIPADLDARAAFYRHRLAGTRTLIVLDNAADTAQIRPLIPGTAGCLVIVTSRRRLAGLDDAHVLPLDVLGEPEAIALFRAIAGPAAVPAGDPSAARVAALCGYLPLAIRIAAARLHHHPGLTAIQLAAQLSQEHRRVPQLADDDRSLAVAFGLSYGHLPPGERAMFLMQGLVPGLDVDAHAAAALAGCDLETAGNLLESLLSHSLVQVAGANRYGLHDLLRDYAREQAATATPQVRRSSLTRLFDHYLRTATAAVDSLFPATASHRSPSLPSLAMGPTAPMTDPRAAQAWLDAERVNLTAATAHAASQGWTAYATALSDTLNRYLSFGSHLTVAVTIHEQVLRAAQRTGDLAAEATALTHLGFTSYEQGHLQQAADYQRQALSLAEAAMDRPAQARARYRLTLAERRLGNLQQAIEQASEVLAMSRQDGDRLGQARALYSLGAAERAKGCFTQADRHLSRALTIMDELGDWQARSVVLTEFGIIKRRQGCLEPAAQYFRQALALADQAGNRSGQAEAISQLGMIQLHLGRSHHAAQDQQHALRLFRQVTDRYGEAGALTRLAQAEVLAGCHRRAFHHLGQALRLSRRTGARLLQAAALSGLADVMTATNHPAQAIEHHTAALHLAASTGSLDEQARAHHGLARAYADLGRLDQASHHHGEAARCAAELSARSLSCDLATLPGCPGPTGNGPTGAFPQPGGSPTA